MNKSQRPAWDGSSTEPLLLLAAVCVAIHLPLLRLLSAAAVSELFS